MKANTVRVLEEKRRLYGAKLRQKDAMLKALLAGDKTLQNDFKALLVELESLRQYIDSF